MDQHQMEVIFLILISIIGFFVRQTISDIKSLEKKMYEQTTQINVIETNSKNLTERFDQLYGAVKELTEEIKHLSVNLSKIK